MTPDLLLLVLFLASQAMAALVFAAVLMVKRNTPTVGRCCGPHKPPTRQQCGITPEPPAGASKP